MLVRSKLSFERKRAGSVFPYYTIHVVQQITIMIWCGLSACGAHFLVKFSLRFENHTLSSGTYPYSQYMGVPPPPPPGEGCQPEEGGKR